MLAVYTLQRKKSAPAVRSKEVVITLPERRLGSPELCKFWRPWEDAIKPLSPSEVMTTIAERARIRAARTETFANWAKARPKKPEHVCAVGTAINGMFTFDLLKDLPHDFSKDDKDCKPNPTALDFSIAMHVDHGAKANLNAFTLDISTGPLSAKRLRQFIADQALIVYQGYKGWEAAFPEFSKENTLGIGIKHEKKPLTDEISAISTHIAWNPQRFWTKVPTFTTWLLNLGGLVTLDTKVTDSSGHVIAQLFTSTKNLGTSIHVPLTEKGIMPGWLSNQEEKASLPITPESNFGLTVSHTVTISFKGLNIVVNDLSFTGTVTQEDDRMSYDGKFTGIGPVEVTGSYKGLSALGMNDTIRTMITEAIEKEVATVQKGNNGDGWLVHASLGPSEDGEFNIMRLSMEVEAAVHITELMRYEADEGNDVMPDKATSFEFKNYTDSVFAALVMDSHRFTCSK